MAIALLAGSSSADLSGRYQTGKQRAGQLQSEIQSDSTRIQGFDGSIGDLEQRLGAIQRSITVQEGQLSDVRTSLDHARTRLTSLQAQYERGRRILAAQLVAQYESPPPTLMNVVVDAQGFDDLLNRVSDLRTVERHSTETVLQVKQARTAVTAQTKRLASIESRKQRAITSVLTERDNVAQLRLSIVRRRLAYVDARSRKATELISLRKTLTRQATILDRQAAAAARAAGAGAAPSGGARCRSARARTRRSSPTAGPTASSRPRAPTTASTRSRSSPPGSTSSGEPCSCTWSGSPATAPRSTRSRSAASPTTRTPEGEASDTPGVEGVPEATLKQFCLTRPFGGAARGRPHPGELIGVRIGDGSLRRPG